jgi:predicted XRE-type DNA-binding protein
MLLFLQQNKKEIKMLTQNQEIRIRMKMAKHKYSISKLATEFGVQRPILSEIINRKRNDVEIEKKLLEWKKGE